MFLLFIIGCIVLAFSISFFIFQYRFFKYGYEFFLNANAYYELMYNRAIKEDKKNVD